MPKTEKATTPANYTDKQVTAMTKAYGEAKTDTERAEVVKALSIELDKSEASIRMKLVREDVYIKPEKVAKNGRKSVNKAALIEQLVKNTDQTDHFFRSMENCTKDVLQYFVDESAPKTVDQLQDLLDDAIESQEAMLDESEQAAG